MIEKKLSQLKPGEKGRVKSIMGKPILKRRIMDMGVIAGSEIEVKKKAPLGDPIDLLIQDYHLSLRKEEAINIIVEVKD